MRKLLNSELKRISTEEYKNSEKKPIVLILDNIRSLYNIGSVFRTSDAFRIEAIHLCGITGKPPHPEIHKSALGATDSVKWEYFQKTEDSIMQLKEKKFKIVAIEQIDKSIYLEKFTPSKKEKYAFIFGNEIKGINESILPLCDLFIEIPQFGTKHSFNISVSAGIILWHYHISLI